MLDPSNAGVYQLKIALRGISPLIWRRLLVRADTSIAELHFIPQLVTGRTNSHLHRFLIHGKEYGIAYDGGIGFDDDPRQIWLRDFCFRLRKRSRDTVPNASPLLFVSRLKNPVPLFRRGHCLVNLATVRHGPGRTVPRP